MKNYAIIFILCFWTTFSFGQSPYFPNNSLSEYFLQRAEIRSGVLHNEVFFNVGPIPRDKAGKYFLINKELFGEYRKDSFVYNYLLNDNINWKGGSFKRSEQPVLKKFYSNPANFYSIKDQNFQAFVNPVFYYRMGIERDYPFESDLLKNERGVEVRGNIAKKIGFYTYFTENQARYPSYVNRWRQTYRSVPGEGFYKGFRDGGVDHYTARGYITWEALEFVSFTFGHNRNNIGSGIRSLMLSDFARDYLHLKINTQVWRFNYQNLFAELVDRQAQPRQTVGDPIYPKKYFASHYLSLDLFENLNIGLYETVLFHDKDSSGRGFDLNYLNPIIFYRAAEHSLGSGDNVILGLTWDYLPTSGMSVYGQFVLDELKFFEFFGSDGWWGNKHGLQVGTRLIDLFNLKNVDLTVEYNSVRPYTYTHSTSGNNFSHFNQPLAHPMGANFREVISRLHIIPTKNLFITASYNRARQGLDSAGMNFGSNILADFRTRTGEYGVEMFQGAEVDVNRFDIDLSYMIKHNLFLDFTAAWRNQTSDHAEHVHNDFFFNFGLRWNAIRKNLYF